MSIGSIISTGISQALDNGAKVQLERDGKQVADDRHDAAAETAAEADARVPVGSMGSLVDMYL